MKKGDKITGFYFEDKIHPFSNVRLLPYSNAMDKFIGSIGTIMSVY